MKKFTELYKKIISEQCCSQQQSIKHTVIKEAEKEYDMFDDDVFNDILNEFAGTNYVQEIEQISQAMNFTLKQYQEKFPGLFDDVTIEIDCFKNEKENDTFTEVDSIDPNKIRVSVYPILYELKYNNGNLDDILDDLEDVNPVIAHELAHILDIKKRGWPKDNKVVHDEQYQKEFEKVTGKRFVNFELLDEETIQKYNEGKPVPQFLYHATYRPLLRKIKTLGLGNTKRTYWEDSKPGVVYLADDPDCAESYAESNDNLRNEDWLDEIIIFKVDTSKLDKRLLFVDENVKLDEDEEPHTYEYHGIIPFVNMELIKK